MSEDERQESARPSARKRTAEVSSGSRLEAVIDWLEHQRTKRPVDDETGAPKEARVRGWMEKLILRTATGVAYAVAIVACLYYGMIPTALLISAMAWVCCSEFFRMVRLAGRMPNELLGLAAAIAYPSLVLLPIEHHTMLVTALLLMGCAVWYVVTPRANIADVAITAFGPIYTSLAFSSIVHIRAVDPGFMGFLLTFGVMGSVWLNDSCAYLVGSRFGKHKLAPRISPNKSTEGFWGGIAASMLIWLIIGLLKIEGISIPYALFTGVVVSISSVVGDLFESRIKRGVGVKDSGDILPGHGGLLDRSDSMLFGGMAAYVLLHLGGIL